MVLSTTSRYEGDTSSVWLQPAQAEVAQDLVAMQMRCGKIADSTCTNKLELTVRNKSFKCSLRRWALQGPPHLQPLYGAGVSAKLLQREQQTKTPLFRSK
jgi:hypothetical protein